MGRTEREFWGLDLETSGTTHERHVPIQLGLAAPNGEVFTSLIGGWRWMDDLEPGEPHVMGDDTWLWDLRAYEVHGIEQEALLAAPSPYQVSAEAVKFIEEHSNVWHGQRKVVGWNVASFDMPFVRKHLPAVSRLLSYQSADLNAICFAISEAHGISFKTLKGDSKDWARLQLEERYEEALWHDAGYDAIAGLHSFDYLKERIANGY